MENIIYQKLAKFMYKEDIYVNTLESVAFGMQVHILQSRT